MHSDILAMAEAAPHPIRSGPRRAAGRLVARSSAPVRSIAEGTDPASWMLDLDALEAYLQAHSPLDPPALDRIQAVD